jgi:hypothetical protein
MKGRMKEKLKERKKERKKEGKNDKKFKNYRKMKEFKNERKMFKLLYNEHNLQLLKVRIISYIIYLSKKETAWLHW